MERIQSAIEKARQARQQGTRPEPQQAPSAAPRDTTVTAPQVSVVEKEADPKRDALWKTVRTFQPKPAKLTHNRILAYQACPEAAPYDMMRTKLMQKMRKQGWRRVGFTSPGAGSGKTMTCLNLAFSLARQSDLKIMVVELDMRRPSIARVLGLKEPVQFSEALAEKEPPEDHLLRYGTNLIFAVNQSSKRHSAELLQGSSAAGVLDRLEAAYAPDVMIFDTPPLLVSDDTLAFLDQIDCALLVAEAERTRPAEVDKCEQELAARTNVLGVVLNKCRYMDRSDSYGYYGY
ncbi:ATPases involved in chromosome partitioning-like protein [Roseobacter sp. AzwK-3b]|uniref:CpsD/CapB family tyrosine-protein kinase n=1 Tax=Roseobacter sp. AzwK-3b TaxID=351016 RepID=UPI000156990A|nr:CpsD/CapB family tyrosine-protein kinase [Roseobacter sp. AzwK-3b]EDM72756.1 ATPases involved in chromosome partitioning-like protein [Roseobacter sp. AzwK-3b]